MKHELGQKIKKKKEFVVLKPKMYSYLTDDGCVVKKEKKTKVEHIEIVSKTLSIIEIKNGKV